jgi:hypothetical protein
MERITAFDSQLVQQGRQASRPNNEEKKVAARSKEKTALLPMALSGILRLRELYYSEGLDAESLVRRGVYLAAAVCFDTGCRISNVTHKANSKANDHCLRGNEVVLRCGQVKLRAGSAFTGNHFPHKSGVSVYQAEQG